MSTAEPIVQERVVAAPPAEVFDAWSDPSKLRRWMCPSEDMREASVEVDFRVGGSFRIVMHGESDYAQHGTYLEIDRPRRLVFTWISEWMSEEERETRVTLSLSAEQGGRTRLRLTHERLPASGVYEGHRQGWARILDLMQTDIETRAEKRASIP